MITEEFLKSFVFESNCIDPQPGHVNEVGDPHFDDHLTAAKLVVEYANLGLIAPPNLVHYILTKNLTGISHYAGKLRDVNVGVGNHRCPQPNELHHLLHYWNCDVIRCMAAYIGVDNDYEDEEDFYKEKENACWGLHVSYEQIHPWIDGNGRSGRLLLLNHSLLLGLEPITVDYADRWEYYARF